MPNLNFDPRVEAISIGRYLLGRRPSEFAITRYIAYVRTSQTLAGADARMMHISSLHPWLFSLFDGGASVARSCQSFRMRICAMSAILETCPEYYNDFEQTIGAAAFLRMIGIGARAAILSVIGLLILRIVRWG